MIKQKSGLSHSKSPLVLVTGASQGIGAVIATVFAAELPGVRLVLVARSRRNLTAVARRCRQLGAVAEAFPCDVSLAGPVAALAREVKTRFGTVDVLINNAGKFLFATFLGTSTANFDAQHAANLRSMFLVSKAFVPAMVRRGRGDVFNMSSIAGRQVYPEGAAYCVAKFGVTGLTAVMRHELKGRGVRVCGVFPGATWTPSWERSGQTPGRLMPAEDIAHAMLAAYRMSRRTVVEEILLRPQLGDV